MSIKLKTNQLGDTIVEVLIAMVIIGLILAISFVAVNYSTSDNERSQERSEAIQLLQNQIEDLRYMATNSLGTPPTDGSAFCISGTSTISTSFTAFTQTTNLSQLSSDPSFPTQCAMSASGSQPQFFIEIVDSAATDATLPSYTFKATAVWQAVGSNGGNDTASIPYRINF